MIDEYGLVSLMDYHKVTGCPQILNNRKSSRLIEQMGKELSKTYRSENIVLMEKFTPSTTARQWTIKIKQNAATMWLQREQFGIVHKSKKITVTFTKCPPYDIFKSLIMLCCFYACLHLQPAL